MSGIGTERSSPIGSPKPGGPTADRTRPGAKPGSSSDVRTKSVVAFYSHCRDGWTVRRPPGPSSRSDNESKTRQQKLFWDQNDLNLLDIVDTIQTVNARTVRPVPGHSRALDTSWTNSMARVHNIFSRQQKLFWRLRTPKSLDRVDTSPI